MNIKIIILIVLIIILIIIGCWYIINLYNKNKNKSENYQNFNTPKPIIKNKLNTSFWKTYGGGKIRLNDAITNAIIPINNKADTNIFSMPIEILIVIFNFLNKFDETYKIIKDNIQENINKLWILKYKLNIYKSKLEYYRNKSQTINTIEEVKEEEKKEEVKEEEPKEEVKEEEEKKEEVKEEEPKEEVKEEEKPATKTTTEATTETKEE